MIEIEPRLTLPGDRLPLKLITAEKRGGEAGMPDVTGHKQQQRVRAPCPHPQGLKCTVANTEPPASLWGVSYAASTRAWPALYSHGDIEGENGLSLGASLASLSLCCSGELATSFLVDRRNESRCKPGNTSCRLNVHRCTAAVFYVVGSTTRTLYRHLSCALTCIAIRSRLVLCLQQVYKDAYH